MFGEWLDNYTSYTSCGESLRQLYCVCDLTLKLLHYSNQIDKQQVRRFKPGQEVMYCQLEVKLDNDKKSIHLKHKVKLQGAKSPRDFFIVTCPPEGTH